MASAPNYPLNWQTINGGFTHDPPGYAMYLFAWGEGVLSDAKGATQNGSAMSWRTSASICKTLRHATSPVAYRRYRGMVSVNLR